MQTKTNSFLEQCANIATGFLISWAMWVWVVAPLYNYPVEYVTAIEITMIFTVTSFIRGFIWRRLFTVWLDKFFTKILTWVKNLSRSK